MNFSFMLIFGLLKKCCRLFAAILRIALLRPILNTSVFSSAATITINYNQSIQLIFAHCSVCCILNVSCQLQCEHGARPVVHLHFVILNLIA